MRVYRVDNAFIFKTIEMKNENEIPCSIWIQKDGLEGNTLLILKNNKTPIVAGGNPDDYECTVVDLSFNEDLNNKIKNAISSMDKVFTVDNGRTDATTWFGDDFEELDYKIIRDLREFLSGIGVEDSQMTVIDKFLESEGK